MKKRVLLAILFFGKYSWAGNFPIDAPDGSYFIESTPGKIDGSHVLWVVSGDNNSHRKFLHQYTRDADAIISPDGEFIALNLHYSSTDGTALVFHKKGGELSQIPGIDLAEIVKRFYNDTHGGFSFDHWYVEVVAWAPSSKYLLLKAHGNGGMQNLSAWCCVYALESSKLSLSLKEFNENNGK